MRRTKIVATLGPSTADRASISAILCAGADVVRLNAAHSNAAGLEVLLGEVRAAEAELGRSVGVLVDLPGPKLRVGEVESDTVLAEGSAFALVSAQCTGDSAHACVTYAGFSDDLSAGDRVLIDDGSIELVVTGVTPGEVMTRVEVGGPLTSNKGVNVPDVTLGVDSITEYDREILAWAMRSDVDYIGQSFVRSGKDVEELRALMTTRVLPIVAKIEKHEAVACLDEIFAAADVVMVARGDLGVETAPEEVPVIQRRIVAAARLTGTPVVIATQMLESMTHARRPTRAEASDVANSIFARVDAVMLSGETAVGEHPVAVVETMARIALAAEEATPRRRDDFHEATADIQVAVSAAVCNLATDLGLAAIVPATESGATALAVAQHRPTTAIIAATPSAEVARRLSLVWGVHALVMQFSPDTDTLLDAVSSAIVEARWAIPGERIAITAGRSSRTSGGTDFILVRAL